MLALAADSNVGAVAQPVHAQTTSRVEVLDEPAQDFPNASLQKPAPLNEFPARLRLIDTLGYYHYSMSSAFSDLPFTVYFFNQGQTTLRFECLVFAPDSESGRLLSRTRITKDFYLIGGWLYIAAPVISQAGYHCDVQLNCINGLLVGRPVTMESPVP